MNDWTNEEAEQTDPGQLPLVEWWIDNATKALHRTVPKVDEYGAYDLVVVGDVLCHLIGWHDAPDRAKAEIGCWFYLLGKVARATEALRAHRLPGDDTPFDVKVYATMIERIRDRGEWS